jgi:hypothetical protein
MAAPGPTVASPVAAPTLSPEAACAALMNRSFEKAADTAAKVVRTRFGSGPPLNEAEQGMILRRGESQGIPLDRTAQLPVHCRVEAYIAPTVRVLVLLPVPARWNGNVFHAACDAFCGEVQDDMPVPALLRGYAAIASDGGHTNQRPFDGAWGHDNRQGEIDFGYRASHVSAQLVKALAAAYYGRPHRYSYSAGFSKGGTAGVKAAQMYPKDFDGILARAPVLEYQTKNTVHFPWIYRAVTRADGTAILDDSHQPLIHAAVTKACDRIDGIVDGVIDDPRECRFDPRVLACRAATDSDCLDAEQVEALRKVYSRPVGATGAVTYEAAQEFGSELDWPNFVLPLKGDVRTYAYKGGSSYLKYLAFETDPGPDYDWLSFDVEQEGGKLDALKPIYDADSPDLNGFEAAGGKLLITHGWGDGAISARMTIRWFEKMQRSMGGADRSQRFARLFVLPGVKHGSGGTGPHLYEGLSALEDWVERGTAPDVLFVRKEDKGVVVRTRPVYPYPQRTRYKGRGSTDLAINFEPRPRK